MRGIILGITFFSLLPFIFVRGPFFGILMWCWVSLMNPQFLVWGSPVSQIPYALIVAVATLLSWAISQEPKAPPGDRLTALLIFWMIWMSVTSLSGIGPRADILWLWPLAEKMLLMTVATYALTNTRERIDQLVVVCALSIGLLGLKSGLWVLLGHTGRIEGPGGMIGGNNELGLALAIMLPLLIYLRQRYAAIWLRWLLQALIALNAIAALFTYSRGALLAICAMLGMAWLRSRRKVLSATAVVVFTVGVLTFAPPKWTERMYSIENYQTDNSAQVRLYMWRLAWAMALKHPILGGGFHWTRNVLAVNREFAGSDFHWPIVGRTLVIDSGLPPLTSGTATHSIWFAPLGEHGFPGMILFLTFGLFMFFDTRWLVRRTRHRPDLDWANFLGKMLQTSLVGFAVGGTFASMYLYDAFYLLVVIAAVARRVVAAGLATAAVPSRPVVISAPPVAARHAPGAIRGSLDRLSSARRDSGLPRET